MASFEFEDITGRAHHPEVQLDELAAMPMTQDTAEHLASRMDSLLEDIAFRSQREYPEKAEYKTRNCEFWLDEHDDSSITYRGGTLSITHTQPMARQMRGERPFVRLRLQQNDEITCIEFRTAPDGIVASKSKTAQKSGARGNEPLDTFDDLRMQYGPRAPAPVTPQEIAELETLMEQLEQGIAKDEAAARDENQLGLRMFSERDALDLMDMLSSSLTRNPHYAHIDPLVVLRQQNARAEAAADTSKLLELDDAWFCAHAVQELMDCFCQEANSGLFNLSDINWRPVLAAANVVTAKVVEGIAEGKRTLAEILGPDSPEGLEEQGWTKYAFDDWPGREDAPTTAYSTRPENSSNIQSFLPYVRKRFGEENIKVIPAQDFFRQPIEDHAHIYVRRSQ